MIKLVLLCNAPPVMAGVEKSAVLLAQHFDPATVECRFILNGTGPFFDCLRDHNFDVDVIRHPGRYSVSWHRQLTRALCRRPPDVVQLHLSRLNAHLIHQCGARVVERLNMTRHATTRYPMRWRALDCYSARWIDHFIVVSETLKQQFLTRGYDDRKMTVVHNGIDVVAPVGDIRQELGFSADTPVIGVIARLTEQKAIDTFLNTAARLNAQDPRLRFVIAGDGELRDSLLRLRDELGLNDVVNFLGYRTDPLAVIRSMDIMFYPSRWEPFANTILEAMAVATPVVATNVGGNAEALEHGRCGKLVAVDDAVAAAKAIRMLLDDETQRTAMIDTARAAVGQYTITNMVQGHVDVYTRLVHAGQ